MDTWPKSGSVLNANTNVWNHNVLELVKMIDENPYLWLSDTQLKYLNIRLDTRNGMFKIYDRDNNEVEPERIMKACKNERIFSKS